MGETAADLAKPVVAAAAGPETARWAAPASELEMATLVVVVATMATAMRTAPALWATAMRWAAALKELAAEW